MFVVLSRRLVGRFRRFGAGQDAPRHERRGESGDRARWTMEGWDCDPSRDSFRPIAAEGITDLGAAGLNANSTVGVV